jgi:type III secretion protein L
VSKKFFSLISGNEIHSTPKNKIIPADSYSKLMEAYEVLNSIKEEADKYRLQVSHESEQIKENAFKEGYEAGFQKWAEHLVKLEQEIEEVHQELQQLVIPVALKAAKKIVAREVELSPEVILDIVAGQLKSVATHKKITIYVNKENLDALEKNKPRIKDIFEALESLSIRARADIVPGGCVIETEIGIINAQLDHRWGVLEKAFENLKVIEQKSEGIANDAKK